MLRKVLNADGLTYIALKAARDFVAVLGLLVTADTFVLSQDSLGNAAKAALATTIFRLVREVMLRFETVPEDS